MAVIPPNLIYSPQETVHNPTRS